jgi:hypothetical protein
MPDRHERDPFPVRDVRLRRLLALACAVACGLAACDKPPPPAKPAGLSPSDYAPPPEVTGAVRAADGSTTLTGTAVPLARIRLASPSGASIGATAGADGRWSAALPAAADVRLLSLSQDIEGRLVRARGYLALAPEPGPAAAILRPGAGARPAGDLPTPSIGSVEFDALGAGVVSGVARPDQAVRVFLDGQEAGEGKADPHGHFDITLSDSLAPTGHSVIVSTPDGRAARAFDATRAGPMPAPPFSAERRTGAWRIDWMTPGGGVQSTVLFDPAGAPG